jgi:hypothetical protein
MSEANLTTTPIRELITSFRKQIDELPREKIFDALFMSTITNRFEVMANEIDELKQIISALEDGYHR